MSPIGSELYMNVKLSKPEIKIDISMLFRVLALASKLAINSQGDGRNRQWERKLISKTQVIAFQCPASV